MSKFKILFMKEVKEILFEYKFIWVPIIFVMLGITQPLLEQYMPILVKHMAEGVMIDPNAVKQTASSVLMSTLSGQFDQLGIIFIVVSLMNIINKDRMDGMLQFIFTRPVKTITYVLSKFIANFALIALAVSIGYFVSLGYTVYYFKGIELRNALLALIVYLTWISFIVSWTMFISSFFESQPVIAITSILSLFFIRALPNLNKYLAYMLPSGASQFALKVIEGQFYLQDVLFIVFTFLWTSIALALSILTIKTKALNT